MADNYLEKRMEDFRNGKLAVRKGVPGIRPRSQRVLIAGELSGSVFEKVLEFRQKGCRVAVFCKDVEAGHKAAYNHGIRFHHVDSVNGDALRSETFSLMNVWRGIDVIIGDAVICEMIKKSVEEWRNSLPIPEPYEPEIQII